MARTVAVFITREVLDFIFVSAKELYPKETVLLLRGKKKKDTIFITDLLVPPLATYGYGFANLPFHMLPMDFSIMGLVHSHPSGNKSASDVDANHFYGRIMMITGYPYETEQDIVAYNSDGERIPITVIDQTIDENYY
ncbi:MAG: peptidase [Nitrososphaerota archaeon]|jgi:proteasome lid subunit RPN8/RPN11|nr:peptidase [Nitrososphaerota archaeon]